MIGCASIPPGSEPSPHDPWESFNRSIFAFNEGLDEYLLKPVTKGLLQFALLMLEIITMRRAIFWKVLQLINTPLPEMLIFNAVNTKLIKQKKGKRQSRQSMRTHMSKSWEQTKISLSKN